MNACTRIFLSLSIVGLLVLAGPLPTADARGGHGHGGHGGHGKGRPKAGKRGHARPKARNRGKPKARNHPHRRPVNRAHARTPARRSPGRVVARRPGWSPRTGFRLGWGGRTFANAGVGRGVYGWRTYGPNWYTPGYSWYYPGRVFRVAPTVIVPTTDVYLTSPGFSGGFNVMVPTSDSPTTVLRQAGLATRN